jgi:hypothetical protein
LYIGGEFNMSSTAANVSVTFLKAAACVASALLRLAFTSA